VLLHPQNDQRRCVILMAHMWRVHPSRCQPDAGALPRNGLVWMDMRPCLKPASTCWNLGEKKIRRRQD